MNDSTTDIREALAEHTNAGHVCVGVRLSLQCSDERLIGEASTPETGVKRIGSMTMERLIAPRGA